MKMSASDKFYIQSLNRALLIIDIIGKAHGEGLPLKIIAEKANLPPSTIYRILENLIAWQYIQEDKSGIYRLGYELIALGNIANNINSLRSIAHPHLIQLGNLTGETIYLSVLDERNADVMYIDKIESKGNIRLAAGIGSRNHIHSTANGKVLLMELSDFHIRKLLNVSGMPKRTESTIVDIDLFLKEIALTRSRGYAIDNIENESGVRCIAAPIFDERNKIVGSISLSGVSTAVTLEAIDNKFKSLVIGTARVISENLNLNRV